MKKIITLISTCILLFNLTNAQVQPYVYFTFDGTPPFNGPFVAVSGGLNGDISSACTTCALQRNSGATTLKVTILPHVLPWTDPDQQYLESVPTNRATQWANSTDFNSATGDFMVEFIVHFSENFTNQVSEEMFRIHPNGSTANLVANAVYHFDDGNGGPPNITFQTVLFEPTTSQTITDIDTIVLDGFGRKSQSYYFDASNPWHHFAFKYTYATHTKEMWVDGQRPNEFVKSSTTPLGKFSTGIGYELEIHRVTNNYLQFVGDIDELAFFNLDVPNAEIYQHYLDALISVGTNGHYKYQLAANIPLPTAVTSNILDPFEFAAGHDNTNFPGRSNELHSEGTVNSPLVQLQNYQLPRFKPGHNLKRNVNILNNKYLSNRDRVPTGAITQSALTQDELAKNWNFYYNITENPASDFGDYNNINTLPGRWVNDANNVNSYPLAAIIFRAQLNPNSVLHPLHPASFYPTISYLLRQDWQNPLAHNVNNGNNFLNRAGAISTKRFISPVAPQVDIDSDGIVMALILNSIPLTRQISFIMENNEITNRFTNPVTCQGLNIAKAFCDDPNIKTDYVSTLGSGIISGWEEYDAYKKQLLDNGYRTKVLGVPICNNAWYSNYAVDGFEKYRYRYKFLRETQSYGVTGSPTHPYPTPDFYPRSPKNWNSETPAADIHGWRWIANGRFTEMGLPFEDNRFAPFVAAGWAANENNNIRPGQWLGMLKCLNLLGVDFYQPGFFNVDDFPYGPYHLPAHPGAYVWQAITPVYAQAVASRYEDFLITGVVLPGDIEENIVTPNGQKLYQFRSTSPDHLIAVRANSVTAPNKYVIAGSIQPYFSVPGNSPLNDLATINLNGETLKFPIRRQGSTYMYDKSGASPIFYQLDEWHEYKHPEWWSKDFKFDAEVYDNAVSTSAIGTEDASGAVITNGDYSSFTSFVSGTANTFEFKFIPRQQTTYKLYIRARLKTSTSGVAQPITIQLSKTGSPIITNQLGCIEDHDWKWYTADASTGTGISYSNVSAANEPVISLQTTDDNILIDKIVLRSTPQLTEPGIVISSAGCSGNDVRFTTTVINVSCHGSTNGQITVSSATGGSGTGYTYSVNNGVFQSNNIFTGLPSAIYKIRVKDSNGAISSEQSVFVDEPKTLQASTFKDNLSCLNSNDGRITASVFGGTSPYVYNWSSGQTTALVTNLTPGTYTVTVSDANGCTALPIATVIISPTNIPDATVTLIQPTDNAFKCTRKNIRFLINSANQGQPYYQYSIDGGNSFTNDNGNNPTAAHLFENVPAGTYNLVMKDVKNCPVTLNPNIITINAISALSINIDHSVACMGSDGALTAIEIGGTAPYTYQWSGGPTCTSAVT